MSKFEQLLGYLDRLDQETIRELWAYPVKDWVSSVCSFDIDGDGDLEVIIGSRDTNTYVVSNNGGRKWVFDGSPKWTGAVGAINFHQENSSHVFIGARSGIVYGVDEWGRLVWQTETGHVVRSIEVFKPSNDQEPMIVVGSEDRHIYLLNALTGEIVWKYLTNGWIRTVHPYYDVYNKEYRIAGGSGDKHLYILDIKGRLIKKIHTGYKIHSIKSAEINEHETLLFVSSDGKDLYAINSKNLEKTWELRVENRILSMCVTRALGDGTSYLIVGGEDKNIYFIKASGGQIVWRHYFGHRIYSIFASDLNLDSKAELIIGAEDNAAHVFSVNLNDVLRNDIFNLLRTVDALDLKKLDGHQRAKELLTGLLWETEYSSLVSLFNYAENEDESYKDDLDRMTNLLRLLQQKAKLQWKKKVGLVRSIALGRVSGGNDLDIVTSTDEGEVIVLDNAGDKVWNYTIGGRLWMVQTADLDSDGNGEVAVGSSDGSAYILDYQGSGVKERIVSDDWIRSIYIKRNSSAVFPEVILGSEGGMLNAFKYDKNSEAFQRQIEPIKVPQSIRAVWSDDFDKDGVEEIIAGADDDFVYAYTRGGVELWRYPTEDRIRGLKVADIDLDDELEILVASEDRNIYVLDGDGQLKWRYQTPHRVLDVDTGDIDNDGMVEVVIASGDGYIYILSSEGDLKWGYKVTDRVRSVRVGDLWSTGNLQIVAGSEDLFVYVISAIDQELVVSEINALWKLKLESENNPSKVIDEFVKSENPVIRAHAISRIAEMKKFDAVAVRVLGVLIRDIDPMVRREFAINISSLFVVDAEEIRRHMDILSGDVDASVRRAFAEHLREITKEDINVGFEYIDRFIRDTDKWVRRTIVRSLTGLIDSFPDRVEMRLHLAAKDNDLWIRQESARAIAKLTDNSPRDAIIIVRKLIVMGVRQDTIELAGHRIIDNSARKLFEGFVYLIKSDLNASNVIERLEGVVLALSLKNFFVHEGMISAIYEELLKLHKISTVYSIADYQYTGPLNDQTSLLYQDFYTAFEKISGIASILGRYIRREQLGDRIASLSDAISKIEQIRTELYHELFKWEDIEKAHSDRALFLILLSTWRSIVVSELNAVRGTANLTPKLLTKRAMAEEQFVILLEVKNEGQSPADNVRVELVKSPSYEIIGGRQVDIEDISAHGTETIEFTLKPNSTKTDLRVSFRINYDDIEAKGQQLNFADVISFDKKQKEFKHFQGYLYQAGTPDLPLSLFFNREEEINLVKRHLESDTQNVMVFYGPRRAGKTALLRWILKSDEIKPNYAALIDLQGISWSDFNVGKFLYKISMSILQGLPPGKFSSIKLRDIEYFNQHGSIAFDELMSQIELILESDGCRMLVMFDEIQELQEPVSKGLLSPDVFPVLRSFLQHRGKYVRTIFSGTNRLETMASQYWNVFFQIAVHHEIRPLNNDAATLLITRPAQNILVYDDFAIERILELSGNQPYFIQLICFNLSEYCRRFEKKYVTINDVNIVLDEVLKSGHMHFSWVWLTQGSDELRKLVLSAIAQEAGQQNKGVRIDEIEKVFKQFGYVFKRDSILTVIENLVDGNAIVRDMAFNRLKISTRLVGLWLRKYKNMRMVLQEIDLGRLKIHFA